MNAPNEPRKCRWKYEQSFSEYEFHEYIVGDALPDVEEKIAEAVAEDEELQMRVLIARSRLNLERTLLPIRRTAGPAAGDCQGDLHHDQILPLPSAADQVLEQAGVGIWQVELPSGSFSFSAGLNRMLQVPQDQRAAWTIDNIWKLIDPRDWRAVKNALKPCFKEGSDVDAFEVEHRLVPDGSKERLWMRLRGRVQRDTRGIPVRLYGADIRVSNREYFTIHSLDAMKGIYVFAKNADLRITYANRALCDLLGMKTRDEIIGLKDADFNCVEEEVQCFNADDLRVLEMGQAGETEQAFICNAREKLTAGGRVHYLTTLKQPIKMPDGEVQMLGISTDVSVMDSQLTQVVKSMNDVAYIKDRDSRFVTVNQALLRLVNKPEEEVLGKTDHDLFPKAQADGWLHDEQQILKSGQPVLDRRCWSVTEEGIRWRLVSKYPIFDQSGKPFRIFGMGKDVTEMVLSTLKLVAELPDLEKTLDSVKFCVAVKDTLGRYVICNEAFARRPTLGRTTGTRDRVIGTTDSERWDVETAHRLRADDLKVMRTREPMLNYEECLPLGDGSELGILSSKLPLFNREGEVIGVVCISESVPNVKKSGRRRSLNTAVTRVSKTFASTTPFQTT